MMITASPDAASIPAVMATWWPKFLENWISLNRGSLALAACASSYVPSLLPSSTMTTSAGPSNWAMSSCSRSTRTGSPLSSL